MKNMRKKLHQDNVAYNPVKTKSVAYQSNVKSENVESITTLWPEEVTTTTKNCCKILSNKKKTILYSKRILDKTKAKAKTKTKNENFLFKFFKFLKIKSGFSGKYFLTNPKYKRDL